MTGQSIGMVTEATITYFKVLSGTFLEGLIKTIQHSNQHDWSKGHNFYWVPPKFKPQALPLQQSAQ
jgi:hypothetical protein